MSDKKDLIIEADDITFIQGEEVKQYYVRVTSDEGNPLENIPLNITFYNDNYSIVNESITNEYGVASMPLILSGGSWFADVHFTGNEEYRPFIVTREVNVEKFVRLDSNITSENIVINIDEVSMNGTYYTIYLKDSNNVPITEEPVRIEVSQADGDDPQTYLDIVLKTDDKGKLEVPFQSYDENVLITAHYYGCTRFKPCTNADIVAFEDVDPRSSIEFRIANVGGYATVQYKIGNGSWGELSNEGRSYLDVIINKEDDNRTTHQGWFYFDSMYTGTYQISLCFDGIGEADGEFSNLYPFSKTFSYINTTNTRKEISDWIESQGATGGSRWYIDHTLSGNLAHYQIIYNYELPYEITYLLVNNNYYRTVPKYEVVDGETYRKTILDYYIINPPSSNNSFRVYQSYTDHLQGFYTTSYPSINESNKRDVILTQTGFGYNGQTYQNIDVTVSNANASMHTKINEYYIMKLFNTDTLEEFYFYSYLVDNVTPSHDEFELGLGNWRMEIVSKDTADYKGAYLYATAELTTEEKYYNIDDFFYDYDNWNEYGVDEIIIDGSSISTIDSNTTIAITDSFTTSNKYSLLFDVEIAAESLGSFMIGSDSIGSNFLGIRNGELSLTKNGSEIDRITIASNISGSWEIERDGNTWNIYKDGLMIYTTTELANNTFGLMNGPLTIYGLYVKYVPAADITPATSDYDGSIFGSNWHIEFREDHLNFADYGMLPEGAVGSGLVIANDVPLPKDVDWDMEITTTYNNKRFDARLNTLYGEIQARLYEDVSTSETTFDYATALCSPSPVPNAKTIFTRHTDEGTIYFVKPYYVISDEQGKVMQKPSYLCNAYNQYKAGVYY